MEFSVEYIGLILGFALILVGIWGALTQKNILKIIIGFTLFDTGLHIIIVSLGYIRNKTAPILDSAQLQVNPESQVVDPIPQALVLTAIVIGLGVTAFLLAYALKLHKTNKSLDINDFKDLKW
jgi:multicomponent Na+:H+ antiporter subunit C